MRRTRHTNALLGLAAAALLPLLGACAPGQPLTIGSGVDALSYEAGPSFPVPGGNRVAALRRSRLDGSWEVAVLGTSGRAPLHGFLDARLLDVIDLGRERVAVVAGSTADCPLRHVLVPVESNRISWTAFGRCGVSYDFFPDGRGVVARGDGPEGPEAWRYQDRGIRGPVLIAAAGEGRRAAPPPSPVSRAARPQPSAPAYREAPAPRPSQAYQAPRAVPAPRLSGPGPMPVAVEERPAQDGPLPSMRLN